MKHFFGQAVGKALKASGLSREEVAYKLVPAFFLDIVTRYLRVKSDGIENIPKEGACIVIANHSGYMAFDALMLGHQIYTQTGRVPRIIAHKLWFISPEISVHAKKLGLVPATFQNGLKMLEKGHLLILFPEGEEGNFKPTAYRYRLRRFRRGFMRLALRTGALIVPATVIGAEETHITVSQIRWAKELLGVVIPVPLNVIPLPAKWKISFLKPVKYERSAEKSESIDFITKESRKIRHLLQKSLHAQLKNRKRIFI